MPGESARRVISEVEASWTPIRTALETLPDAALEAVPPGTWSAKETLAHLAFWSEAVEGYMTLVVRQRPLPGGWLFGSGYSQEVDAPWPHFEVHNAREAAWGRSQQPAVVRARMAAAHEGLVRFLETVTDAEVEADPQYFAQLSAHYREHSAGLIAVPQE